MKLNYRLMLSIILMLSVFVSVYPCLAGLESYKLDINDKRIVLNEKHEINTLENPDQALKGYRYLKMEHIFQGEVITSKLIEYRFEDYPIVFWSWNGRNIDDVTILFDRPNVTATIYDMVLTNKTSLQDVLKYYGDHFIEVKSYQKNTIESHYSTFEFDENLIISCKISLELVNAAGNPPWWVNP